MTTRSVASGRWQSWSMAVAAGIVVAVVLNQLVDLQNSALAGTAAHRLLVAVMVGAGFILASAATLRGIGSRIEYAIRTTLFGIAAIGSFWCFCLLT